MRVMKVLTVLLLCWGCSHGLPVADQQRDLFASEIGWEEIVHHNAQVFMLESRPEFEDPQNLQARYLALPPDLQKSPELARLAIKRSLENPQIWESGVAGILGTAKYYVTTTSRIKDFDQLYVIMVRMLSQKYGCLMIEKQNFSPELTRVRCRDFRQILMWRSIGPDWIQFYARQFDRDGYEIMVKQRRIVRISDARML